MPLPQLELEWYALLLLSVFLDTAADNWRRRLMAPTVYVPCSKSLDLGDAECVPCTGKTGVGYT